MNTADSERMGSALEKLGLEQTLRPKDADVIVLNSCVVRQNAEDRVVGMLTSLKPWREASPKRTLALMGCMVGPKTDQLQKQFPFVDVFMQPQNFTPLIDQLGNRFGIDTDGCIGPHVPSNPNVTAHVPIIHGCDKFCSFCIIPHRRGREVSRPIDELVHESKMLSNRGVREITLLGQNVDSYGHDLQGAPDLADLLYAIHEQVPSLSRIRFLTSHPNDMSDRILNAVSSLPRVMENLNLPFQAGSDEILEKMRRGYTNIEYRRLIDRVRSIIPGVAVVTDLIVGFPSETEDQFIQTLEMVKDLRFDKVHSAAYSPRPNTLADRKMEDDVTSVDKKDRLLRIEALQKQILSEMNAEYKGTHQEVLIDGSKDGIWRGRTRTDKLVYFDAPHHKLGDLVNVIINKTTPWSLKGEYIESNSKTTVLSG